MTKCQLIEHTKCPYFFDFGREIKRLLVDEVADQDSVLKKILRYCGCWGGEKNICSRVSEFWMTIASYIQRGSSICVSLRQTKMPQNLTNLQTREPAHCFEPQFRNHRRLFGPSLEPLRIQDGSNGGMLEIWFSPKPTDQNCRPLFLFFNHHQSEKHHLRMTCPSLRGGNKSFPTNQICAGEIIK